MTDNDLQIENQTLRARVAALEAEVRSKQFEITVLRRAARTRKQLDVNAKDMFQRPLR